MIEKPAIGSESAAYLSERIAIRPGRFSTDMKGELVRRGRWTKEPAASARVEDKTLAGAAGFKKLRHLLRQLLRALVHRRRTGRFLPRDDLHSLPGDRQRMLD